MNYWRFYQFLLEVSSHYVCLMLSNPLMLKSCSRKFCLRNCLEFKDTFDNNLEIEYDFVKYLNESCCKCPD